MKRSELKLEYADVTTRLVPLLRGRVFHITCRSNVSSILQLGAISNDPAVQKAGAFGNYPNSFFKRRNCVSVFDYRNLSDEELDDALGKCGPHRALGVCGYEIAIFFLAETATAELIPWTVWKEREAYSEMVVPYAEAGYPRALSLSMIDELLEVSVHYVPSWIEQVMAASRKQDEVERSDEL
jgi:hypothetical protein